MGNLYCKIFGHSKTHWPVGLGGSAVFVWCSTCGKEFENESLDMRNKVHKLEQEVKDLERVVEYYKSSNESLQKNVEQYVEILDRFCKNPMENDNNGWTKIGDLPPEGSWYKFRLVNDSDRVIYRELFLDTAEPELILLALEGGEIDESFSPTHYKEIPEELEPLY